MVARVKDKGEAMKQKGSGCDYEKANRTVSGGDSGYRDLGVTETHRTARARYKEGPPE